MLMTRAVFLSSSLLLEHKERPRIGKLMRGLSLCSLEIHAVELFTAFSDVFGLFLFQHCILSADGSPVGHGEDSLDKRNPVCECNVIDIHEFIDEFGACTGGTETLTHDIHRRKIVDVKGGECGENLV